ncbi:MAG: hypothetical protein KF729_31590 [Sandaracinaceae bacterium]|nr:hypothetical protein [Sandaracinaceae bacterium]
MPTLLPQNDPRAADREAERARARATYRYTWHRPEGVATAAEVPRADAFSASYLAQFGAVIARMKAHEAAVSLRNRAAHAEEARAAAPASEGWLSRLVGSVKAATERDARRRADPATALRWFGQDVPPLVAARHAQPARDDELFAWQRLGGANPMKLRAVRELPDAVPADEAAYAVAAGEGDSLARAASEGRLFVADWRWLAGAHTGATPDGEAKRLDPAAALFATAPGGAFVPVAIRTAPERAVLTPADGVAWSMAKLSAQTADLHEQALVWHLGHCHFLMEAFALATRRELAAAHPLRRLLAAHTEYTLAINAQVRDTLMKPGGDLETLLSVSRGQALWIVQAAVQRFDYAAALPPRRVRDRGLGDPRTLRHCPYRDDGLDVWDAIHAFAGDYVGLYYAADADVREDEELRAFCRDLRGHWGGRLASIPEVEDRDALVELVTFALWSAGPLHTICNYSQYEMMSDSTSMPVALFGPPPAAGATEGDRHASYLPEDLSMSQWAFFYEQTRLDENRFGAYAPGTFDDPRVGPLEARFREALDAADARIVARNATRPSPYEWLRPSVSRASIHS